MKAIGFLSVLVTLFASIAASACPPVLQKLQTTHLHSNLDLCELSDRYYGYLSELERKGFKPPTHVGNLMAPRFINLPDWLAKRSRNQYRAWTVYDPEPTTWGDWVAGAKLIDKRARHDLRAGVLTPLTLDWLKLVHGATLEGLIPSAGKFRDGTELGLALDHQHALTEAQSSGARHVEYPALLTPDARLVSFVPTQCLEDRSPQFQQHFKEERSSYEFDRDEWPRIDKSQFFTAADGQKKQCGYLVYAPLDEVQPQLQKWLEFVNSSAVALTSPEPSGDPIFIASKAQRWLIAIHPYERGNGRMSRFVMDWLMQSLGLPPPILKNMDFDMYSTADEWADEVGDGLVRAVSEAHACVLRPGIKGCTVISTDPPQEATLTNAIPTGG